MNARAERPLTLLIAALGGEGGGVLSQWLVAAAEAEGYPVQSTSIPGVAQRTGATTYYVEMLPLRHETLGGRTPVFALTPAPGSIDVMVASELLEAGRAMQNGFVSPERTVLIASTHRTYAIGERVSMGDGRFDGQRVVDAATKLAKQAILFDMKQATQETRSVASAILLGAIAGSGKLPLARATFEEVIRDSGIAVESNLAGFAAGYARAERAEAIPVVGDPPKRRSGPDPRAAALIERVHATYPQETWPIVDEAVSRLVDYQGPRYARRYLDRLDGVRSRDGAQQSNREPWLLTRETGRYLAVWMAFEDVIRVADLKTRAARFARVAREVGAKPGEPVTIVDFLKPGVEEFTAVLPSFVARPIQAWAERKKLTDRLNVGLYIRTTSISGFLLMWTLARLRWMRGASSRFADEMAMQERWLDALRRAAERDYALALEVAECARLIKGYGSTYRRGRGNFLRIFDEFLLQGLAAGTEPSALADGVRRLRTAALADPDGKALDKAFAELRATVLAETRAVDESAAAGPAPLQPAGA